MCVSPRLIRYVQALGLVLAAILSGIAPGPAGAQGSSTLRAKAADVDTLLAKAAEPGGVRVIVTLSGATSGAQSQSAASSSTQGPSSPSTSGPLRDSQVATSEQTQIIATHLGADDTKRQRWSPRLIVNTPYMAATVTAAELETLAADSNVVGIHEDGQLQGGLQDSVPLIGMGPAYDLGATGTNHMVAVLDTGVEYGHVFMSGRVTNATCFSTTSATFTTFCPNGMASQIGGTAGVNCGFAGCAHGTHVAGIAAGNRASGTPRNGVAKGATIFAGQVFSRRNSDNALVAFDSDMLASLNDLLTRVSPGGELASRNVAAINMSIWDVGFQVAGNCDADARGVPFKTVIDSLRTRNVATVIISGNNAQRNLSAFPGCISSAVTVGATSKADQVASYSNSSTIVDLLAPGGESTTTATQITSSVPPTPGFTGMQGTSMAAPHVTGAFAAVRSACTTATVAQVQNALVSTGTPIFDTRSGGIWTKPRIRVDLAAIQLCGGMLPHPANDNFANATKILSGQTLLGGNFNATKETGEPNHNGNVGGRSIWYKYTALSSGQVVIKTAGSNFDTLLAVYTGAAVNLLAGVASNDDFGGTLQSQVAFTVNAGQSYYIAVDGFNGAQGTVSLNVSLQMLACDSRERLGDFNGDGRADFVTRRTSDGTMAIYLMNGPNVIGAQVIGQVGLEWTLLGVADFNGDGKADLLLRRTDGTIAIFLMNGFQILAAQIVGQIGVEWELVGIGDVNGDGKADFLTRRADGLLAIYLMNGLTIQAAQIVGVVGSEWRLVGVADFNGDGRSDLMFRRNDGTLSVYQMNGFQIQGAQLIGQVGIEWTIIGVGDVNGDGRADFLTRRADGLLALYLVNGFTIQAAQVIGQVGVEWSLTGVGDANGDGRADLQFRRTDGGFSLFLMNGFQILDAQVVGNIGTEWSSCYGPNNPPLQVSQK